MKLNKPIESLIGQKLSSNDVINGGSGVDTIIIGQENDNIINLSNVENLVLKNIASGKNIIEDSNNPLLIRMEAGKNNFSSDFSIIYQKLQC